MKQEMPKTLPEAWVEIRRLRRRLRRLEEAESEAQYLRNERAKEAERRRGEQGIFG